MEASPGLTARSLGDLDDGPLRAVVAAWGNSGRSGIRGERTVWGCAVSGGNYGGNYAT